METRAKSISLGRVEKSKVHKQVAVAKEGKSWKNVLSKLMLFIVLAAWIYGIILMDGLYMKEATAALVILFCLSIGQMRSNYLSKNKIQ